MSIDVSVIVPIYNGEPWIDECFAAIERQDFSGCMEVSVFDDSSVDDTAHLLEKWTKKLGRRGIEVIIGRDPEAHGPGGVGRAKNRAVRQSRGRFLCFQDVDDVMTPDRIRKQYEWAFELSENVIVGSRFDRNPPDSTRRFTEWACRLTPGQLVAQAYTANGPTIIMPTWFMSRSNFDSVGCFVEEGKGCPEDFIFFLEHLRRGGGLYRCDDVLLSYRYHENCETLSVTGERIWDLRVEYLENDVLSKWDRFTIWNAGKQGRKLYRSLKKKTRDKVALFCDVDPKKISLGHYTFEDSSDRPKPKVPIVHFSRAQPPIVICVKQNLTGGNFEANLMSLNLCEGKDYLFFS